MTEQTHIPFRAVIDATMAVPSYEILAGRRPAVLGRILDRPFLQHIIETLVAMGISRFDVLTLHHPEQIQEILGDGRRWGADITCHLVKSEAGLFGIFSTLKTDMPVLFARGDHLPVFDAGALPDAAPKEPVIIIRGDEPAAESWPGWALIPESSWKNLSSSTDYSHFFETLQSHAAQPLFATDLIRCDTLEHLLAANIAALENPSFDFLLKNAPEVEKGIWVARDVALHPDARIIPPVYLDETIRIEADAVLGPGVVVGTGSMVARETQLENALIFPGTYVGEGLEIHNSVLDRDCLVNTEIQVETPITERFILGDMDETYILEWLSTLLSRAAGLMLALLLAPLIFLTALFLVLFRKGPLRHRTKGVRLPAAIDPFSWNEMTLVSFAPAPSTPRGRRRFWWKDFLCRFLPGLIHVIRGEVRLTGVAPRTRQEMEAMDRDWLEIYVRGRLGLITEALIHFGACPSRDDHYAAETVYISSPSVWRDFRLILSYFRRLIVPVDPCPPQ